MATAPAPEPGQRSTHTLLTCAADAPVTCLHVGVRTGIIVVGRANGAVLMVFPRRPPARGDAVAGAQAQTHAVGEVNQNGGETGGSDSEYRHVVLRKNSVEAIRTAWLDEAHGLLYVTVGDAHVLVWELAALAGLDSARPELGAHCEVFACNRAHTYGACVNAFLLQHERTLLFVFRSSVTLYQLDFAAPGADASAAGSGQQIANANGSTSVNAHANGAPTPAPAPTLTPAPALQTAPGNGAGPGAAAALVPLTSFPILSGSAPSHPASSVGPAPAEHGLRQRQQPAQSEVSMTTSAQTVPLSFDGRFLVSLRSERPGEYFVELRDWSTPRKSMSRVMRLQSPLGASKLAPFAVQTCGDVLMAVEHLDRVSTWSADSGKPIHRARRALHGLGSRIVAAVLCCPVPDLPPHARSASEPGIEPGMEPGMEPGGAGERSGPAGYTGHESVAAVSVASDGSVVLSRHGAVLQRSQLPKERAHFALGGPYWLQPTFRFGVPAGKATGKADGELVPLLERLVYSDDVGVHVHIPR